MELTVGEMLDARAALHLRHSERSAALVESTSSRQASDAARPKIYGQNSKADWSNYLLVTRKQKGFSDWRRRVQPRRFAANQISRRNLHGKGASNQRPREYCYSKAKPLCTFTQILQLGIGLAACTVGLQPSFDMGVFHAQAGGKNARDVRANYD